MPLINRAGGGGGKQRPPKIGYVKPAGAANITIEHDSSEKDFKYIILIPMYGSLNTEFFGQPYLATFFICSDLNNIPYLKTQSDITSLGHANSLLGFVMSSGLVSHNKDYTFINPIITRGESKVDIFMSANVLLKDYEYMYMLIY